MPRALFPALAAAAVVAAFLPSLGNGFVNFDDGWYLVLNPNFKGWTWEHLRWMFTPWPRGGHYAPLTWMSLALDWSLWGMRPLGYHLTSLALHAAGAAAFYAVARRLFERVRADRAAEAALLASLFFALHPLRVESVAWASERRDVLSGLFYLLTLRFYLDRRLGPSLACFAASLLSKGMAMTLPLALVLLDFYPLRRLSLAPEAWLKPPERSVWLEKLLFLAPAAAIAGVTLHLQVASGSAWALEKIPVLWRAGTACYGLMFYIAKTLLPVGLAPLYPMPPDAAAMAPTFALCGLGVAAATGLALLAARQGRPALLAVWAFYAVTLAPVSGLVQIGPQIAADRYSYLPCLGFALLFGWGVSRLASRTSLIVGSLWILFLAGLTWKQTGVWRDAETLWAATAAAHPRHAQARLFLGNLRAEQSRPDEAEALFRKALALEPGYGAAHNNLANLLVRMGRDRESLAHYGAAAEASPGHKAVHYNWGIALMRLGRGREAAEHFRQELLLDPGHEPSRRALGSALLMGKTPKKKSPREAKLPAGEHAQGGI
ncbi:MAG: tetratricopeptide repeat protein [Elusimicrobiota bacterium]